MIKDIPAGVARVLLAQGAVYLRTTRALLDAGLSLDVGDQRSHFSEVAEERIAEFGVPLEYRPELDPDALGEIKGFKMPAPVEDGADAPEVVLPVDAMLNELEDWTLPDHNTLQFRLRQTDEPLRFDITDPIVLPPQESDLEFSALLGAHRAAARLQIRLVDADDVDLHQADLAFDANHHGGTHMIGYKEVKTALPPCPEGGCKLYMSVLFDRFTGKPGDPEPYLFVADPNVHCRARADAIPAEKLHNNPGAEGRGMIWAVAELATELQPSMDLSLIVGDVACKLKTGIPITMRLVEDNRHTLKFESSEPGRYQFLIDGQPAFERFIGTEPTAVRIPDTYFNGESRQLSIWDMGGARCLFTTYILTPRTLTPMEIMWRESRKPFPGPLAAQAVHRYEALKGLLAAAPDVESAAQAAYVASVLEGGHRNVKLKPLVFPDVPDPVVSIIIPAHNKIQVTYLALASLLFAPNETTFEVILVDDASTDDTVKIEDFVSGISVIHNQTAQRFIRSCNAGAAVARGSFVLLLNNDVEVTAGWLDALLDAFQRFPNVGLVGSKLIYPDGRLQDAGGVVWNSGNPWQYGNGRNPWNPKYCYARQVDYLSGAAMMTSKAIWDEVGGLSSYLEPMYFEDTDFAFKVREAGYTTWFVPSSVVYHYEGVTAGTDTGSGFKRYQEINRPKFKRRWAADFRQNGRETGEPDLEKDRNINGRVLFIDTAFPRPDRDAGSYAAIEEIKLVQALGYKVTFLPNNLAHLGSYTDELERMGVETAYAPFYLSTTEFLERRGAEFDAVYITRYNVAQSVLEQLHSYAPRARVLFNNADLHFLRELRTAIAAGDPDLLAAAEETRKLELEVMREVDVVLSYNETEHAIIESHTEGKVKVMRCPWVVDLPEEVPGRAGREGLSFLGNYQHMPNAEGIAWFAQHAMPLVNAQDADITLSIYGSSITDEIMAMASDTVLPVGFIEDVADAYDRHRIFIAPLLSGAGIKGKVLAALAHGVPCVLSPVAAEGIGLRHKHDCMIARTPQDWADAIIQLSEDDALWDRISGNARAYVREEFSFAMGVRRMRDAFEAADIFSAMPTNV